MEIHDDGKLKFTCLGPDLVEGDQKPQYTVPPNIWFGSFPTKDFHFPHDGTLLRAEPRDSENHFSLVGCTCAPGFQFEDFELAKRSHLLSLFPQHESLITMLSYPEWWWVLLLKEETLYVVLLLQNLTYEPTMWSCNCTLWFHFWTIFLCFFFKLWIDQIMFSIEKSFSFESKFYSRNRAESADDLQEIPSYDLWGFISVICTHRR